MTKLIYALALFSILCSGPGFTAQAQDTPPNIILIMSDDQGWGDIGFNGHPDLKTPHLDAMAANGIIFERFYAASPLCSPSRASCLTGRVPFRTGVLAAHTAGMRVGEITIAEALRDQGYRTGFFGKWHVGWVYPDDVGSRGFYSPPWHHGFDETFATTSAVPTWDPTITPEGWNAWGNKEGEPWKDGTAYVHNGETVTENLEGDDSRIIMDRVIPFIENNDEAPFFAAVWFHAPHEPVVAGPEYRAMYAEFDEAKQHYYGCITAMDEQVGRLRAKLRELGIEKNTVIFFCSDNGPAGPQVRAGAATAGPFKGTKHTMYEGGLLVPACAEWPGTIEPGQTTDQRCGTVDYFPTLANIAGYTFSNSQDRPIDGADLMPVTRGETIDRPNELFFGYRRSVRGINGMALIDGDYKIVRESEEENPRTRLYNISIDPFEKNDLAEQEIEKLMQMLQLMAEHDQEYQRSRDGADYRY